MIFKFSLALATLFFCGEVHADSGRFRFEAEKYSTNLDSGVTKASGNVHVWIGPRTVIADNVQYSPQTGNLQAQGNVIFEEPQIKITGSSVNVNADTGFGSYENAIMLYGPQFSVEARELTYYDKNRFRADYAKISSCVDCPQAWSVTGSLVDIEIEGFAKVHNAMVLVKDMPLAYFPVFYVPVKSKRQSGFLVPQMLFGGELGSGVIFPYFWAISPESDATLRYDYYQHAGNRAWGEFRYLKSDRSYLSLTSSYNANLGARPIEEKHRYGVSVIERAQLSEGWVQRFSSEIASDPRYTYQFGKDFFSTRQPTLPTDASLVWQNSNYFFQTQLNLSQDNIERDPNTAEPPYGPINMLPFAAVVAPTRPLGLGIFSDWQTETMSLRRDSFGVNSSGLDETSQVPWIRTGDRFTGLASIYRPSSIGWLTLKPELNLRFDQYRLTGNLKERESAQYPSVSRTPNRVHMQLKQDVETTLYKIFQVDSTELKAIRHSFTPTVSWSYSPDDFRTKHPFFDDVGAPRFDIFDPNSDAAQDGSTDVLAERMLKQHNLLFFGFRTQLTGRFGTENRSYEEFVNISAMQAYNIQASNFEDFTVSLNAFRYGFTIASRAAIEWQIKQVNYRNVISFDNKYFGATAAQIVTDVPPESGLSKFAEYQLGLNFKHVGPFQLSGWMSYDGLLHRDKEQIYKLSYQSASKCWYFSLGVSRKEQIGSGNFEYAPYLGIVFNQAGAANYLPFP